LSAFGGAWVFATRDAFIEDRLDALSMSTQLRDCLKKLSTRTAHVPTRRPWDAGAFDANLELVWPTTMRFGRQLAQAMRGADYARSIQAPVAGSSCAPWLVIVILGASLLAAVALVLWTVP
jgi:hypothetical protein